MVKRALLLVAALAAGAAALSAAGTELSARDLARIKSICDSLVGQSVLTATSAAGDGGVLRPYLRWFPRGEADPGRVIVQCGDTCTGTLPLRGHAEVHFTWPHQLKRWSEIHVSSVRLLQRGRVVYVAAKPTI